MIRASWHSRHEVVAFPYMGPAGRLSVAADDFCEVASVEVIAMAITTQIAMVSLCNMNFHLIGRVVQIAARVP